MKKQLIHYIATGCLLLTLASCGSTKKNTPQSRFYQSFVTRYNVYYNGNEAYKEGLLAQEKGHKDNYMELIPFFPLSNVSTQKIGGGSFDKAIEKSQKAIKLHSIKKKPKKKPGRTLSEKDKKWYAKKEYNPFLHNAWMLMGKAQFQKGEFLEAASTFSYITRLYAEEPDIVAEAKMYMGRCYAELDWVYEAEHIYEEMQRDSISYKIAPQLEAALAAHLLKQERFEEALPHLEKAMKKRGKRSKKQQAREYYLLGQVYKQIGRNGEAYEAFKKAIRKNPPYELEFNARIQQTEIVTSRTAPKMIKTLKRMAKNPNNKEYLDQVYYAIGNIHLAQQDTLHAIASYEKGVKESTRNGVEKGILLLQLGGIYWDQTDYVNAQRCYAEAIGIVQKEDKNYEMVNFRSTILDELVEHTVAIDLQDSLQHLATLPEEEVYAVVDKIIEEVIRKEEEEKKAAEDAELQGKREEALSDAQTHKSNMRTPPVNNNDKSWYFYNTQLVAQGKKDFQQRWGRRKLEDNWRRANKSVLADASTEEGYNYDDEEELTDSLATDSTTTDAITVPDSTSTDPHDRMFYIQHIPYTDEQMKESNDILQEALWQAGMIYKDKLEDFGLAERTFQRIQDEFPDYENMDELYYNCYLMYSRWKRWETAQHYAELLKKDFPEGEYTKTINDPEYAYNAIHGKHIEDSLYAATYADYHEGRFENIIPNAKYAEEKFPLGAHRPKFMFLQAMTMLQQGDQQGFLDLLKEIVTKYPKNEISELAGLIAQGMQEGRLLQSSSLGSIWSRRLAANEEGAVADSLREAFDPERLTPFTFILVYEDGTLNENQLLFEMARYNFTQFMVRNFEITTSKQGGLGMLHVKGFISFDEAYMYQHRLYQDKEMAEKLSGIHALLISDKNLELLLKYYSIEEYLNFYKENFSTLPALNIEEDSLDEITFEE